MPIETETASAEDAAENAGHVGLRATRKSYQLCYGHYYDAVPCNHGHSKIEAEFQLALQDALGLFQYVWY